MSLVEFQKKPVYPVVYMFVVMLFFTAILVGLARSAADRVEANNQIRFERAVLLAVGVEAESMNPAEVHAAFVENIQPPTPASAGAYTYPGERRASAASSSSAVPAVYAIPFEGQGFWNVIKGVVGIKPDGKTVTGIAFYEQSETPGLGAEIVKPPFRDQFRELTLAEGPALLRLKPAGSDADEPGVDAISGATQTCTRLERILNDALKEWRSEMVRHHQWRWR